MIVQQRLTVRTHGRGTYDITAQVAAVARRAEIAIGLCHVFCHHTSASLILCENADPTVRRDLEAFLGRLVPDGDHLFDHTDEGPGRHAGPCSRHSDQDGPDPAGDRGPLRLGDLAGGLPLRAPHPAPLLFLTLIRVSPPAMGNTLPPVEGWWG